MHKHKAYVVKVELQRKLILTWLFSVTQMKNTKEFKSIKHITKDAIMNEKLLTD